MNGTDGDFHYLGNLIGCRPAAQEKKDFPFPVGKVPYLRITRGLEDLFNPFLRSNVPRKCGQQLSPLANQFVGGVEMIGASMGNFRRKILQVTPYEGLHRLLDRTYTALTADEAPPVTYEDMDSASRLVDALVAEENRT